MQIGFIGAGRVGCSIGKYFVQSGIPVSGYYDQAAEAADSAASFTATKSFGSLKEAAAQSSLLFITTPDSIIVNIWEALRLQPLQGKIICHCSGALPSSAFTGIGQTGASCCSLHPMLPFSSRYASYQQLAHAFFTVEGQDTAVRAISKLLESLGNTVCQIDSACKPAYHAAASILSNQVTAVLDTGYRLLESCGFTEAQAIQASSGLVRQNIENVLQCGCTKALTGPIERNDLATVQKHLDCLNEEDKRMYQVLGLKLIHIATQKNPAADYSQLQALLEHAC